MEVREVARRLLGGLRHEGDVPHLLQACEPARAASHRVHLVEWNEQIRERKERNEMEHPVRQAATVV
jgi:hypothetical protein